jgi:hypothetical protein
MLYRRLGMQGKANQGCVCVMIFKRPQPFVTFIDGLRLKIHVRITLFGDIFVGNLKLASMRTYRLGIFITAYHRRISG